MISVRRKKSRALNDYNLKNCNYLACICVLILMGLILSYVQQKKLETTTGYFTGEVKFRIQSDSLNPQISDETIQSMMGENMTGIVGEDKYKMFSINKSNDTTVVYYDLVALKVYYDYPEMDTIFSYPLDKNSGELVSVQLNEKPKKEMMGEARESVTPLSFFAILYCF